LFAGLGFGLSMLVWRSQATRLGSVLRAIANVAMAVAIGGTVVMAAFWTFVWQPRLAEHLSSKRCSRRTRISASRATRS